MKSNKILRRALTGILCSLFIGSAAMAAPVTMKLATTTTNDAIVEWFKTLKTGIEARAGDRIKVEIYPSGQLGSAQRTAEGVAMGTVEASMNASGFFESLEPRFGVLSATGIFDSIEHGNQVLSDPQVREVLASYQDKGYEVLTAFVHAPVAAVTRQPYLKGEDIQSKKIRVPGSPLYLAMFRSLGAAPLSMTLGEVLPAIQNGTIDGAIGGNSIFTALKFYDATKSMTYLPSTYIAAVGIINSQFLASLSPELREIVKEEVQKADQHIYTWTAEDAARARTEWERNGGNSYQLEGQEAEHFIASSSKAATEVFSKNAQQAKDYEVFKSVAEKYRAQK